MHSTAWVQPIQALTDVPLERAPPPALQQPHKHWLYLTVSARPAAAAAAGS
jgi:hypothetical protein